MKIRTQAIRLALLVEGSSLLVFFGQHSRTADNILSAWFGILNMPTILLFRSHTWVSHGGQWEFPLILLIIIPAQAFLWFLIWYGLLFGFQKLKAKWRRRAA